MLYDDDIGTFQLSFGGPLHYDIFPTFGGRRERRRTMFKET